MAEITNAYIEARREGIAWLNSAKREYNVGVAILLNQVTRQSYHPSWLN